MTRERFPPLESVSSKIPETRSVTEVLRDQIIKREMLAELRGYKKAIELLRGEEASRYSFDRYQETKCSKNDAHITRYEWAKWLEDVIK